MRSSIQQSKELQEISCASCIGSFSADPKKKDNLRKNLQLHKGGAVWVYVIFAVGKLAF